ncbi:hypothetical protein D3C74_140290 [compost metagenome]
MNNKHKEINGVQIAKEVLLARALISGIREILVRRKIVTPDEFNEIVTPHLEDFAVMYPDVLDDFPDTLFPSDTKNSH